MVQPLPSRWAPRSFLSRLPPEQVIDLLEHGVRRHFDAGRRLLREGDRSTHVEVLLRGFVKITNIADGTEVLMAIRMPGDLIGELAGLTGNPRIATATACGRVTATVLTSADFHRFLQRHPEALLSMAAGLGDRLRWSNARRADFAAFPAEVRVARLLVDIADDCGRPDEDGLSIGVELSQPELATMIGVSEATVQKVFRELRENGVIRTGYRRITVLDMAALRAVGEGGEDSDGSRTLTG
jgi:CRP-like cAMP-binding protein